MVEVAPVLSRFLVRPPTPPRESYTKLPSDTPFLKGTSATHALLDTPDESPASSAEYFKDSSGKPKKKVGFSGWTQYHRPSSVGSKGYDSDEQRRRVPPSKECNPTKSILKPYIDVSSVESKENIQFDQTSLPGMLRSAALHLASDSRPSKIDAYTSLLGCLSAYDDVPEPQELAEKVGEIAGAVRRDVAAKNGDGTPDAQLAAQALKLVTVLLCTKGTIHLLPEDFCSFIFEQSIACMEDPTSPKMLISHQMHLVEKQKFSPKILTAERLNRLLSVLGVITTRVKGNRVVCHRLNIYQRLITQARTLMISRIGSWIDNLVSGMLSTIKDVRARAIAFGMEAGLQLGTISSVSQECANVFNRQSPEGTKVVDFLESRLTEMTKNKEDGLHVPQIWSVVLLFFRSRPQQIERWEHLKSWLGILQQCFNSSDAQIKFQANIAWNRFIFALDISTSTSISMARMLKQPIVSQLERKSVEKNAKLAKNIARSSYCTLLYYALRPSATYAQLDQFWDLYVVEMLPKAFSGSQADIEYACDIFATLLFNKSQPRVWDPNKANTTGPMKPEDLPNLDSKWLRSKTESILGILEKLFELAEWKDLETSPVTLVWRNFMSALGNASSKEVKVSMGTMTAVAKIVDCLKRLLVQRYSNSASSSNLEKFNVLLKDAVAKIGHIPFNEKRLLLTQSDIYEAAAETPSSRGSSKSASLDSAAAHLINLLLSMKAGHDPGSRQAALETVIHLTIQSTSSRRSRLKVLRNIARHISLNHTPPETAGSLVLWACLAKQMISVLGLPRTVEKHNESPEDPGHEYRDVLKVLELGVHSHSKTTDDIWSRLLDSLCETLGKEVGNIGVILVVQEPLAEVIRTEILKQFDDVITGRAVSLLKNMQWPINSKIIEHAQMQLWGVMPLHHKSDPMESLKPSRSLSVTLLEAMYANQKSASEAVICSAISVVTSFMNILPSEKRRQFVRDTQQGFALWIEDAKAVIVGRSDTFVKVQKMFETVMTSLESAPKFDGNFLAEFQYLLVSCLRSRHKSILNQSILMWNRTLGAANTLKYSEELRKALLKLRDATDIQLPDFPDIWDSEAASSPLHFVDSQESEEDVPRVKNVTPNKRLLTEQCSPRFSTPSRRFATASPNSASVSKGLNPPPSAGRDIKTTPKAKLKHDNSQIQFAAIESSPMAEDSMKSQMLTDRQNEVKERQEREAALFPDIRSSPRDAPIAAGYRLPMLAFRSTEAPSTIQIDETTSPSFPPDAMMNDFLGSSPTPSSSRKRSEEPYSDEGPPSSPLTISSHLQMNRKMASPQNVDETNGGGELLEDKAYTDKNMEEALPMLPPMNIAGDLSGRAPDDPTDDGLTPCARPSDVDTNLPSDMDVYVDAPTEPSREISLDPYEDKDAVEDLSQRQESSHAIAENDQVTAQLMDEIAKASSQRAGPQSLDMQEAGKATKKRKDRSADTPRKRMKGFSWEGDEASGPSFGEVVADCVLIDARPSTSNLDEAGPVIKADRSVSPQPIHSVTKAPDCRGNEKADEEPASLRRRIRLKAKQGANRRSERVTRTSSRLSDVGMSSPNRGEASLASPEQAGGDLLPWINGPRGSRWAYLPATAPANDETFIAQPPATPANDDHDPSASQSEDVVRGSCPTLDAAQATEAAETPTPGGILTGFKNILESIKKVTLRPEEERTLVGLLFESVQRVHEAGRRHRTA